MRPVVDAVVDDDATDREAQQKRRLYWKTFVNLTIFILFVILFLVVTSGSVSRQAAMLSDELRVALSPVHSVTSLSDVYNYLALVLPLTILPDQTDMARPVVVLDKLKAISTYNAVTGGIRLRQHRVSYSPDCGDSLGLLAAWTVPCHPGFSPTAASAAVSEALAALGVTYSETAASTAYSGTLGVYPAASHSVVLSSASGVGFTDAITQLRTENFLDGGTRTVFVEFNVWNVNSGHIAVVQVVWELGHRGEVLSHVHVTPIAPTDMKATGNGTGQETLLLLGRVLVFIFTIYYFVEEALEIASKGKAYLHEFWNYVDWLSLLLVFASYVIRFATITASQAANFGVNEVTDGGYYTDLLGIAQRVVIPYKVDAFNAIIITLKCIKYVGFVPYIQILVVTLKSAGTGILAYLVFLLPVLTGITVCFNVAFGQNVPYLASFWDASFFLASSYVGEARIEPLIKEYPKTSVFIVYITVVTSVLFLALLFSIIAKALQEATEDYVGTKKVDSRQVLLHESLVHVKESLLELISFRRKLKKWMPALYRKWYVVPMEKKRMEELNKTQQSTTSVITSPKTKKIDDNQPRPSITSADYNILKHIEKELTGDEADRTKLVQAVEVLAGRALRRMNDLETEMKQSMLEAKGRILELQVAADDTKAELNKLLDQGTSSNSP